MRCQNAMHVAEKSGQANCLRVLHAPNARMQGYGAARDAKVRRKNTGVLPADMKGTR
jgi:hypothetical protein